MDDNTAKLLEKLASKLGTTTEYLWGILVRQAHIDATITLIQMVGCVLFGIILWKIHKRLLKKDKEGPYAETGYEKYEAGAFLPMIFAAIVFSVWYIASVCSINTVINGYFNPEYWALDTILSKI